MKRIIVCVMVLAIIASFASCGNKGYTPAGNGGTTEAMSKKVVDKNIDHKSVGNDTNLGLMSVKINSHGKYELNDTEKLLIQYFDSDYETVEYNALQRYPQIYNNIQIVFTAKVKKLIETNNESYTALVQYGWYTTMDDDSTNYAVIKGNQGDSRVIEGDYIFVYGKYIGVDSYSIDGVSYSVPTILVNRFQFGLSNGGEERKDMYSVQDLKLICRYIFGDNFTLRELNSNDNFDYAGFMNPYVCVLDNQSNANFSKYVLDATNGNLFVDDVNGESMGNQTGVYVDLIFAADFEHFYVKKFDSNLDTLTLQCYDKGLNKIWSRDFEETTSVVMDYTPDHIYLVANSSMYILDAKTGENATDPTYVGSKDYIRKIEDGILLIETETKSDAVMKTDLEGKVLWTANSSEVLSKDACSIQIPDENYRIFYYGESSERALVLSPDGDVIYDAESF